ncbi:MAG: helix-turn-helix domain-containing protein [Ilumatobacter sp.]|jgi:excisionase family DNA binding protein|uniref:helix-turn-helix domain-containing protein n=1 Tax=Ilumatobacter sp. TaxID=1967498 RepID=UPI00391AB14F
MLAVVGSGEYLPAMGDVDRQLIELFDTPPTVVCLPTAAGTEGDALIDSWMQRGVDHFTSLGGATTPVRVWDRDAANDPTNFTAPPQPQRIGSHRTPTLRLPHAHTNAHVFGVSGGPVRVCGRVSGQADGTNMSKLNEQHRATLTVVETATILGISRTTAYESVRRGEIPARRFDRRVGVLRHELERLLASPTR